MCFFYEKIFYLSAALGLRYPGSGLCVVEGSKRVCIVMLVFLLKVKVNLYSFYYSEQVCLHSKQQNDNISCLYRRTTILSKDLAK